MVKYIASGVLVGHDTRLHADVVNLNDFIMAEPDAEVNVYDDDGRLTFISKEEVVWDRIEKQ
jgi:hypothetical protein